MLQYKPVRFVLNLPYIIWIRELVWCEIYSFQVPGRVGMRSAEYIKRYTFVYDMPNTARSRASETKANMNWKFETPYMIKLQCDYIGKS